MAKRNEKCEKIEDAWLAAGMKIKGGRYVSSLGRLVCIFSFKYAADKTNPEMREKMVKVASDAGFYLFLDYGGENWESGRANFVIRNELRAWARRLDTNLDELTASFDFLQEEPALLDAVEILRNAREQLDRSIVQAKDKKNFCSNEESLREHIDRMKSLRKSPRTEVNQPMGWFASILVDWHDKYL